MALKQMLKGKQQIRGEIFLLIKLNCTAVAIDCILPLIVINFIIP